jgi:aryl-alcohol dehydrogenase-like predicted oxidoreductase
MKYQLFGKSGLRVSQMALGTMTFGEDWGWGASEEESRKVYDAFLEAGGNFIDTANLYTNGSSEQLLGKFMGRDRERLVLATKFSASSPTNDPNASGNQRKNMVQAVEASLKQLNTDYIDLYWLHIWDGLTPVEEVMRAFDDLVRQGKVLYVGVSDAPAWWVSQANTLAQLRGWSPFIGIQVEYSLIERTPERDLLPMAESFGLTVAAWSPLAGGELTGKYHTGASTPHNSRYSDTTMQQFLSAPGKTDGIIQAVKEIAVAVGCTPAQVALAWLKSRSVAVIPIIGARHVEQIRDNLAALDLHLDTSHLNRLDEVSRPSIGFPYEFYAKDHVRSVRYGDMRDRLSA